MDVRKTDRLLLGGILILAAALRLWGIGFGLPHPECKPDETIVARAVLGMLSSGSLNPHFFDYPSLFLYLTAGLYTALGYARVALGIDPSFHTFLASFDADPTPFLLAQRLLSCAAGIGVVGLVYLIGKSFTNTRTGLLGALFMAVAYLPMREAHFGVTDSVQMYFICLSVYVLARARHAPQWRDYALAGTLAGLAAATKYAGVFLVVPMAALHLIDTARRRDGFWRRLVLTPGPWLFVLLQGGVFLAATPYAILDHASFAAHNASVARSLNDGFIHITGRGWVRHLTFSLYYGMGPAMLLAAAVGMVLFAKRDYRSALLFAAFPVAFYAVTGRSLTVFPRYILPVAPFVCVGAAVFVDRLAEWPKTRRARLLWALAAVALIVFQPLRASMRCDELLARKDNRLVATEWLYAHIPPGSSIYQTGNQYARLDLPAAPASYRIWWYNPDTDRFIAHGRPTDAEPDYIIVDRSSLFRWDWFPRSLPGIERRVRSDYDLQQYFWAQELDYPYNYYDHEDAFYLPYAGFRGAKRPGPNFYIYIRKDLLE